MRLVVLCCVGYTGEFAIYYCKCEWLTESHQSYYQNTAFRSCMSASSMGYTGMHSSYTNRRGVEQSLRMINTPSTVKESQLPSTFSKQSGLHVFTTCSPKLSRSSYFSQASLSSLSSPIDRMRHGVALNCSLNRHTEYVRTVTRPAGYKKLR